MRKQLYKLINGKLVTPPRTGVKKDGGTVTGYNRMSEEALRAEGWKELVTEPYPDEDKQYEEYYEETDTVIVKKWREYENE